MAAILWNTAGMHMRTLAPAALVIIALATSGCGLLETNDDELETLRVEIIQLREDFMDLEAEVSLLARVPATTTSASSATATTAAPATTTSKAASSGGSSSDEADDAPAVTVPVGLNEDAILTATYNWGPSDPALILQEMLGITSDGWYGNGTRAAHLAELDARGLATDGVPSPPTTTAAPEEATTEAPAADDGTADTTATTEAPADDDGTTDATTTTEAPAETTTTTEAPAETTTTAGG